MKEATIFFTRPNKVMITSDLSIGSPPYPLNLLLAPAIATTILATSNHSSFAASFYATAMAFFITIMACLSDSIAPTKAI